MFFNIFVRFLEIFIAERESSIRNLDNGGRNAIVSRNSDSDYVKKVIPKSDTVKTLILDAMRSNTLFKACSDEEFDELVDVFSPSEVPSNTIIIAEGDEGDEFFVMERGTVDVYVGNSHMAVLRAGSSFGELALMYGCPRSATLRARFFCKLWSISRTAFRGITSQIKRRRNEEKIEFLKKVNFQLDLFPVGRSYFHFSLTHSYLFMFLSCRKRSKSRTNYSATY